MRLKDVSTATDYKKIAQIFSEHFYKVSNSEKQANIDFIKSTRTR